MTPPGDAAPRPTCLYPPGVRLTAADRQAIADARQLLTALAERRAWHPDEDLALLDGAGCLARVRLHPEYGDRGDTFVVGLVDELDQPGGPTWHVVERHAVLGPWDDRYNPYRSRDDVDQMAAWMDATPPGNAPHTIEPDTEAQGAPGGWDWRGALITVLAAIGIWYLLPGRIQGAICNCPVDRGEALPDSDALPSGPHCFARRQLIFYSVAAAVFIVDAFFLPLPVAIASGAAGVVLAWLAVRALLHVRDHA